MTSRFFLPGLLWTAIIILLFLTPLQEADFVYFDRIPARSFVHCLLFWGFVHSWLGGCKKQLKYGGLRRRAFPVVVSAAVLIALLGELIVDRSTVAVGGIYWNLLFDFLGILLGALTFKLLYKSCY